MRKQLLMKTFLVAVCLLVGSSVWAKTSVWSENFESTTIDALKAAWTGNDGGSWGSTYSPNLELQTNKCNNSTTWFNTYSPTLKRQSTAYYFFASAYTGSAYQFDAKLNLNLGSNGGESRFYIMNGAKAGTNADPSNYLFYIGVNSSGYIYISNGTDSEASTIGGLNSGANSIAATLQSKTYKSTGWFNASCIIDFEQNKVTVTLNSTTTLTVSLKSGTEQISGFAVRNGDKYYGVVAMDDMTLYSLVPPAFTLSENSKTVSVGNSETVNVNDITGSISVLSSNTAVATASYDAGVVTINGIADGVTTITVTGTNDGVTLDKTIDVTVGSVATTTVTINYLCGGSSIAEAATIEDVTIGSILTLSDISYSETLYGTGCRYVNPSFSVDFPYTVVEDGVINISYTQQNSVSTLNIYGSVAGNNYLLHTYALDGKYVGDAVDVTYPEYYFLEGTVYSTALKQFSSSAYYSGTYSLTGTDPVLTYNSVESNVVYFSEAENIVGGTSDTSGNAYIRCSDSKGAYFESATDVVTLPAGRYTIHSQVWGGHNTDDSKNVDFTFNDGTSDFYVHRTTGALNPKSQEFTLTSPATITVIGGSSGKVLDLVYIVKTGEVATIPTSGYGTIASAYALDCANLPDGLKAYQVTELTKETVTLEEVTEAVAAGTGLILKGTASETYAIPVAATGADISATNKLQAAVTATAVEANETYILQGGQFHKVTAASTIPAGKAYLRYADLSMARELTLTFGDATAIKAIDNSQLTIDNYYNLKGQRVAAPQKGLYIQNGKKVIVK